MEFPQKQIILTLKHALDCFWYYFFTICSHHEIVSEWPKRVGICNNGNWRFTKHTHTVGKELSQTGIHFETFNLV